MKKGGSRDETAGKRKAAGHKKDISLEKALPDIAHGSYRGAKGQYEGKLHSGILYFLKMQYRAFIESFRPNLNLLYAILADVAYYLILSITAILYVKAALPIISLAYNTKDLLGQIQAGSIPVDIESQIAQIKGAYVSIIAITIVFFLILIANFSYFKGLIWKLLLTRKTEKNFFSDWRFYIKIALLNILLFASFAALTLISAGIVKQDIYPYFLLLVLLPMFAYAISLAHPFFASGGHIKCALKDVFRYGFAKVHWLLIPVALIILISLFVINNAIRIGYMVPSKARLFLVVIASLVMITWSKHYIARIIEKAGWTKD